MYQVGWSKSEIVGLSYEGYAMMGWGMWHNRATGQTTPLYARSFCITDDQNKTAIICCLDTAYVTYAMRKTVVEKLSAEFAKLNEVFDENSFVITATHTHSGPGGCSQESLYNVITPGYLPTHVQAVANAVVDSVLAAKNNQSATDISYAENPFDADIGVAWNRSVQAYNRNPEVKKHKLSETHLATDRNMRVLSFERDGQLASLLSIFNVHATCVGNTHSTYNGDNKGYASAQTEETLAEEGINSPVAVFAQGAAGDISPYFQGKGDIAKRAKLNKEAQVEYAQNNGRMQTNKAIEVAKQNGDRQKVSGGISSVLAYYDFSDIKAYPKYANGNKNAYTADPCIGVSMFEGTRVDGPGMPKALGFAARKVARNVKRMRLAPISTLSKADKQYYKKLYQAHGKKDILMESERKLALGISLDKIMLPSIVDPTLNSLKTQAKSGAMKQSPMVASVLPLQIIRIGQLAIVCCPGEFSTISGERLQNMLTDELAASGVKKVVVLCYCNEYMGYVTTNEEYQLQLYEAGHTIYGQWTQAAFQTKFEDLAKELSRPEQNRSTQYQADNSKRPAPMPAEELKLRTNLKPPKKW